ncbi:AI-2E family transporter [Nonlabens sp. Ci31]|jgi:predicted PurR-regulated permease PerM|uniref:AI-2E family transporter n=1 Tax=Nonlabens sp. Ci31 TaxID=2608253 RepID=UPI0014633726|nr:AI-2E family transporter [Nonlabens sp. Ci31]QJP33180.1 AI-2E family transporter [Nonlabens sp. Ci31]
MTSQIPTNKIRQLFILLVILCILILIGKELAPYLGGVLGAITLYVLLEPLQKWLENRKWKPALASSLLISLSFVVILLPIAGLGLMMTAKIKTAIKNSNKITETVKTEIAKAEELVGMNLSQNINSSEVSNWISKNIQNLANSSLTVFISVGIMLFLLYFMLVERNKWLKAAVTYMPLNEKNLNSIGRESIDLVKSNAIGIPLVALLQGIVALIGYFIFGVENPFFWFVITTIGSMIPFVGTALGILPVCILMFAQGHTGAAIGILIYGLVVVGSTDNLFRLVVQKRLADVHPLVTLIGVVVGVPLFGFIGLIFGPLLVSLLLLLVKMYKNEYGQQDETI